MNSTLLWFVVENLLFFDLSPAPESSLDSVSGSTTNRVEIGHAQQINVAYTKIFATGNFVIAYRRWNEKDPSAKTWANFKVHFAAAHRQHKQMQGESAANYGYHASNAAVFQTEDQMAEANI
jgi:hypothetical protein